LQTLVSVAAGNGIKICANTWISTQKCNSINLKPFYKAIFIIETIAETPVQVKKVK